MTQIRLPRAAQRDHAQLLLNLPEMQAKAVVAEPLYLPDIMAITKRLRELKGPFGRSFVDRRGRFRVAEYLSYGISDSITFEYVVAKDPRLSGAHAVTETWCGHMIFDQRLFADLEAEAPRARSIHAHEIGHAILHTSATIREVPSSSRIEEYQDPEQQAWAFARELLFPWELHSFYRCRRLCREMFGISDSFYDMCRAVRRIPTCDCCG